MLHEQAILWVLAAIVIGLLALFQWYGKLPSPQSLNEVSLLLNSRGGNILVLGGLSLFFFIASMRLIYWCLDIVQQGKLAPDNAVMMLGLTFVTGSAFGGSFGALLKTMTGEDKQTPPQTDQPKPPEKQ